MPSAQPESLAGAAVSPALDVPVEAARVGRLRWTVCALLFFATTINYIDRAVVGILGPTLKEQLHWDELQFARINLAFQGAYAIGLLVSGRVMDVLGSRKGLAWAVAGWSVAAMAHALARTFWGFAGARFALGLTEAGNFPACIKTVSEWFPKKERALATGLFNSGCCVGAVMAPLVVPWIAGHWGWSWAFVVTGASGFVWLAAWLTMYHTPESHPRLTTSELQYIQSDPVEGTARIPWIKLFPHRQAWAVAIGKFLTDPVWWFFLFWLPSFFKQNFGVGLTEISLPLVIVYLMADVGSIAGGWLSSHLIRSGHGVNSGRKLAMLACALCVVPVYFASVTGNKWVAIGLIGLALAAHQGWSANMFTLASDMFPRRAVGSVVGFGGMAGAVGGLIMSEGVGRILKSMHDYRPVFLIASFAYLFTLLIVHLLAPQLKPAPVDAPEA